MCWKCYKAQVENEKLNLPGLQPVTGEKDGKLDAKFSGWCTMVYRCPFRRAISNVPFRCEKVLELGAAGVRLKYKENKSDKHHASCHRQRDEKCQVSKVQICV